MCGGPDIPPPDPAVGQAALDQIALSKQMYEDYIAPGGDRDYQRNIANQALGIFQRSDQRASQLQDYQLQQARKNDSRYWGVAVPYEDQLISEVNDQDTEAYRNAQVSRALADTQQQVDNSRREGIREMTRRGANPESGAFGAMMADGGRAQALAMATAANKTRLAAQQVGLSNKMQMYGGMKGLAGLGATSAQIALGAGSQSMQAAGGMTSAALGSVGANNAAFGTMSSGISAGIQGYNGYYSGLVNGINVQAQNDPMNTILGAAAGAASRYAMGKMF